MLDVQIKGDFNNTETFLKKMRSQYYRKILEKYARAGVEALRNATPVDSGKTAESWTYDISYEHSKATIVWKNTNVNNYVNIALILQYGHGTGTGGWVEGRDYINPALKPIFDKITKDAWEEVTK